MKKLYLIPGILVVAASFMITTYLLKQKSNKTVDNKNKTEQTDLASKKDDPENSVQENKSLTKNDAVSLILKKELGNQKIPKYFIPVKSANGSYDSLVRNSESNAFLCNDNNRTDNGILVELTDFNQNNQTNNFIIKDYNSLKNGGHGLVDRGTITNTGEVKISQ